MINFSLRPALLLIDIQQGFEAVDYWGGNRNNGQAEENSRRLLEGWRGAGLPVFFVTHNSTNPRSPLYPGQPGNAIQPLVQPRNGEPVIGKSVNSAFIGTDLEARLREQGITQLVVAGLTTDHCVSTSVRMAGNLGFDTYLVEDATATFDRIGPDGKKYPAELIHAVQLASLSGEFARIVTTQEVLAAITAVPLIV